MDYKQYGTVGKEIFNFALIGTNEVFIQNTKGEWEKVILPKNDLKKLIEFTRFIKSVYPGLTEEQIYAKQGTEWHAYNPSEEKAKEIEKAYEEYVSAKATKDANTNVKVSTAVGLAATAMCAILALDGCGKTAGVEPAVIESTAIETTIDTPVDTNTVVNTLPEVNYELNLEKMSYEQLVEVITKGTINGQKVEINETQRQFLLKAYNFINDNAQQQSWEHKTFSAEELEAVNKRLEELGYPIKSGDTTEFGFKDISYVFAAMLRFGNYTDKEMAEITGASVINAGRMTENSNEFVEKAIQTYLFGYLRNDEDFNENHYNPVELFGFNEHEEAAYNKMINLMREYNQLIQEGNYKAAEAKMIEIEDELLKTLTSDGYSKDYKAFMANGPGMGVAIESQLQGYKREREISVWDKVNKVYTTITIKTEVGDAYVEGIFRSNSNANPFDGKQYLERHGVNTQRYDMDDSKTSSVANTHCAEFSSIIEGYNVYVSSLSDKEKEEIRKNTFKLEEIVNIINKGLESKLGKYHEVYDTFTLLYLKELININTNTNTNTNGNTNGTPVIPGTNGTTSSATAQNVLEGQNPLGLNPTTNAQSQAQAALNAGAITESQAAAYLGALQSIFDATYNYYYGQNVRPTSVTFDSSWLLSTDPDVINTINSARAEAEAAKAANIGVEFGGGESHNNQGIGTLSNTTAPEADKPGPTHTEEVVNPNQNEIDSNMADVEANSNANSGNAQSNTPTSVDADKVEVTEEKITAEDVNNQPGAPQTNPNATSTNQAPNEKETFGSKEEAEAALASGYQR